MLTVIMRNLLSLAIGAMMLYVPEEKYRKELESLPTFEERVREITLDGWVPATVRSRASESEYHYFYRAGVKKDSPTLVCLHGFNTDAVVFFNLKELAEHFNIVAFNFPERSLFYKGELSDFTALLDDFLETIAVDSIALLGNSVGGGIAMHYAATTGKRHVAWLLLASTNIFGSTEENSRQARGMADKLLGYPDYKLFYLLLKGKAILARLDGTELGKSAPQETVVIRHVDWYRQVIASMRDYRGIPFARRIRCPVLAFHGSSDRVIPVDAARIIPREIPDARLVVVEGAGHSLVYSDAGEIIPIIGTECALRCAVKAVEGIGKLE